MEIAENKTKIISCGRFAEHNAKPDRNKKPDTVDFLGFTHYAEKVKKENFVYNGKLAGRKFKAN